MARIRTIKPELPQSGSLGRVSRDARLLFIQTWTLCDDSGVLRGSSRMLASLLYPYDDGEKGRPLTTSADVESWLVELERESCIQRYSLDGDDYIFVCNWLTHQKIDRPSASKYPPPPKKAREGSRGIAKPRRRTKDQGRDQGREGKGEEGTIPPAAPSGEVEAIFAHWQKVHGHQSAKLGEPTSKRYRAIAGRLKDGYTVEQLRAAIEGCKKSAFNMGDNDRSEVYDDIELICRDQGHVDKFIRLAGVDPRIVKLTATGRGAVAAASEWLADSQEEHRAAA